MRQWLRRIGRTLVLLTAAAGTAAATPVLADSPVLGNNSENIINGGILARTQDGDLYYADTTDKNRLYDENGRLSKNSASYINVLGSRVYYLTDGGNRVMCYDMDTAADEECFSVEAGIDEMYVAEDGTFYYLSEGDVFARDAEGEITTVADASSKIRHFIPAEDGVIYATGSRGDYDLYANGDKIRGGVTSFYEYDGYLIMNCGGTDKQAKVSKLFGGDASSAVKSYSLDDSLDASTCGGDDDCDICDSRAGSTDLDSDWDLAEHNLEVLIGSDDDDDLSASTTGAVSSLYDASVSEGQRNIVRRAYQMHLIKWTPLADIVGWNYEYTYSAGTTYSGLPYGQPVDQGAYVPWSASLETFAEAVNDLTSKMYTSYSTYNKRAPYYSTDCSGFASWAWNLKSRAYSSIFANYGSKVASQSVYSAQIGDVFVLAGSHVAMVSDVGYIGDKVAYIDIIEQTPPVTKLTRFGSGGSKTLEQMSEKYFGTGYILYRSYTRDSATYTPSKVVTIFDEVGGDIKPDATSLKLNIGENYKITYTTNANGDANWSTSDKNVATVKDGVVTAVGAGKCTIAINIGAARATVSVSVVPEAVKLTKAKVNPDCGITLTWEPITGASYYLVYRMNSVGNWVRIAQVTEAAYTDQGSLVNNTVYTYTVKAVVVMDDGTVLNGSYDGEGIKARTCTATPEMKSVSAVSYTSQKITWDAVDGADGYYVYMKKPGDTSWTYVANTTKTSHTQKSLTCGTTYTYSVRSYYLKGTAKIIGAYAEPGLSKMCIPATPALTAVTALSNTSQQVTWKAVAGAETYRVYVKEGTSTSWKRLAEVKETSYTASKLTCGTKYRYTVRALCKVGETEVLSGYNATGLVKVCCPKMPELKTIANTGSGVQKITWTAVDGADGYRFYIKGGKYEGWTRLGVTAADVTSYKATSLDIGTNYTYTVRAYKTVKGVDVLSDYDAKGITLRARAGAPKLKTITAVSTTSQKVSWHSVAGATGYSVYIKKDADDSWSYLASTTDLEYVVNKLTLGKRYYYTVRSYTMVNSVKYLGAYDKTGVNRIVCPATPVLNKLQNVSYTSQKLTWTAVEGAQGYRVYGKTGSSTTWKELGDTKDTSWTATSLSCGTRYTYTVRAFADVNGTEIISGANNSGLSAICTAAIPSMDTAVPYTRSKIKITWKSVAGADAYNIYRKNSDGTWKLLGATQSLSFVDDGLTAGSTYTYTVASVRTVNGKSVVSEKNSKGRTCTLKPAKVEITSVTSGTTGKITAKWTAVTNPSAMAYRVYYKTSKTGSWIRLGETGDSAVSASYSGLKSGSKIYVTVRAFWIVNGTYIGGDYNADGVEVTVK